MRGGVSGGGCGRGWAGERADRRDAATCGAVLTSGLRLLLKSDGEKRPPVSTSVNVLPPSVSMRL